MSERCKVFRFAMEPWRTLWLRRDESLFTLAEWSWVGGTDEAWIFDSQGEAERQMALAREELTPEEAGHLHVFIYGSEAVQEARERRERRERGRGAATLRSAREIPPSTVYAETCRHLGERE